MNTTEGALETIEKTIEEITGTATPGASVGTLIDWFARVFQDVANSDHPPLAAAKAAETVAANKDALTAAVLATPAPPTGDQGPISQEPATEGKAAD